MTVEIPSANPVTANRPMPPPWTAPSRRDPRQGGIATLGEPPERDTAPGLSGWPRVFPGI
jgi:hypothetical protein